MNKLKSYILGVLATIALGCGLPACQDSFDAPDITTDGPVASLTPNTTIAELKEWMWNNTLNYCDTVYTRDYFTGAATDPWQGEHVIISGRVISSDYAGNCFKYIILQDATGALSFSINSYNLYLEYRRGQEIVVDLTGLFAGKYRGLFQIGFPSWNSSNNGYETSFLAPELFVSHRQLNGWPEIENIDTIEISSFSELGTAPSDLQKWQSQLIRINNVTFSQSSDAAAEGITTLSTYHSSGVSQTITASDGSTGAVRTSGYANFWNMELPEKPVDVILIASYYGSNESNAAWQFTLIDAESIITDPTVPKGSKENPYSIGEAIEFQANPEKTVTGWVYGYIVGTVAPELTEVANSSDIEWNDTPIMDNTMVIAPTPDCTDVSQCLVFELPQNSSIAKQAIALKPENYKKEIVVKGSFQSFMGTFGLVTAGSDEDYMIDGKPNEVVPGDGSEANPYSCAQVIAMAPTSTTDAVESGVWMGGYIVGYYNDYAPHFETAGAVATNILMSDNPNASAATQCVSVQLPVGSVRDALNLASTPGLLGQYVAVYGDVMKYNTLPGIKNTSKYAMGDVPTTPPTPDTPGEGDGNGSEANPYNCASIISLNPQSTTEAVASNVWAEGYVVGYYENYEAHFEVSTTQRANILLSDNQNATDKSQTICIQLLANTETRNALNLVDNPGVLGKKVQVFGDVMKYNTLPGIKNTSNYKLDGQGGGNAGGGDTPSTPTDVMTVAEALAYINAGNTGEQTVKGQIVEVGQYNAQYGQVTYYIADAGSSDRLQIYSGFWLNGEKFTSASQLEVGATVTVKGTLKTYNGNPEMDMRSIILAYEPPTGGGNTGGNTGGGNTGGDTGNVPDPGQGTPGTVVFDFTHPDTLTPAYPATEGSATDNANTYEAVSNVQFTDNGVGVSASKGNSTDARIYYQSSGAIQYRIYNGSTLTIVSSNPMTSISFDFNNASSTLNGSDGNSYTKSNPEVKANGATKMTFSCTATVQINKITVVTE